MFVFRNQIIITKKTSLSKFHIFDHPTTNSLASKAVDGNRNPIFEQGSCSHTVINAFFGLWWRVDLLRNYQITRGEVFPRKGDGRLRHVYMFVHNNSKWIICKVGWNILQPQTICFDKNCFGQIFQVKQYSSYPLILREIKIYGYNIREKLRWLVSSVYSKISHQRSPFYIRANQARNLKFFRAGEVLRN